MKIERVQPPLVTPPPEFVLTLTYTELNALRVNLFKAYSLQTGDGGYKEDAKNAYEAINRVLFP